MAKTKTPKVYSRRPYIALAHSLQVQLEPIRRVSGGAAGQLAPKYTGMLQAVRTIVREEGVLVSARCPITAARPCQAESGCPDVKCGAMGRCSYSPSYLIVSQGCSHQRSGRLHGLRLEEALHRVRVWSLPQALWRGTLAGQLLYVPYTTVQFVTLQQVSPSAAPPMNLAAADCARFRPLGGMYVAR